ncbi:restriction endonuclease subunit S, partial [Campylobacter sp. LR185c]
MVERGTIFTTQKSVSELAKKICFKGQIYKKGTLLLSFKLTIGRTSFMGCDGFFNEAIAAIIPRIYENSEIFKKYLWNLLGTFTNHAETTGAIKGETLNK